MKTLRKLPPHLLHTEQAGAKFAGLYVALSKLKVGGALELEVGDFETDSIDRLNHIAHSATQTLQVRKGSVFRFGVRLDRENRLVYIVRKEDKEVGSGG